ncbi:MAG: SH3 domain-containing protein, partial [Oscillospiraceae bacterium]|nr:SH3 domain-containing protein [Oscillospiraceae bacterium]
MKRKPLRALALSLALLVTAAAAGPALAEEATVTAREVNVREGPGMNYDVFISLPRGFTVTVTNRSNAEWYAVSWDGNSGYIAARYLELAEPADRTAVVTVNYPESRTGTVTAMYLYLRSGPGKDHAVLDVLTRGKALTIFGSSGDWLAVDVGGKVGYVHADYVALDEPSDGIAEISFEKGPAAAGTISQSVTPAQESPALTVTPIPAPTPSPTPLIAETS